MNQEMTTAASNVAVEATEVIRKTSSVSVVTVGIEKEAIGIVEIEKTEKEVNSRKENTMIKSQWKKLRI
jgi:hypothetical protein